MCNVRICNSISDKEDAWRVIKNVNPGIENEIENFKNYTEKVFNNAVIASYVVDEKSVGILAFYANDFDSKVGYVTQLAVDPDFQGKGIATKLMDFCCEYLINIGFSSVKLEVKESNIKAKSFYKKMGFALLCRSDRESVFLLKEICVK